MRLAGGKKKVTPAFLKSLLRYEKETGKQDATVLPG